MQMKSKHAPSCPSCPDKKSMETIPGYLFILGSKVSESGSLEPHTRNDVQFGPVHSYAWSSRTAGWNRGVLDSAGTENVNVPVHHNTEPRARYEFPFRQLLSSISRSRTPFENIITSHMKSLLTKSVVLGLFGRSTLDVRRCNHLQLTTTSMRSCIPESDPKKQISPRYYRHAIDGRVPGNLLVLMPTHSRYPNTQNGTKRSHLRILEIQLQREMMNKAAAHALPCDA